MARKGLLHFTIHRELQETAVRRFGEREPAPSESLIGERPARSVVEFMRRNKRARTGYRRISRNAGRRLVDRTQKRQRALDLIDTRLMISSWRSNLVDTSDTGLVADIRLENEAPYASFAHPKGTPRSNRFVVAELPRIVDAVSEELAVDQAEYVAGLAAAIAADAARSAFIDLTVGGR